MVMAVPDPPAWVVPPFPLMAAEDEAMVVSEISLRDPDNEPYLRVNAWAEKGRLGLPGALDELLDIKLGVSGNEKGNASIAVVGNETALNVALAELVYYPPQDWTSFKQVRPVALLFTT